MATVTLETCARCGRAGPAREFKGDSTGSHCRDGIGCRERADGTRHPNARSAWEWNWAVAVVVSNGGWWSVAAIGRAVGASRGANDSVRMALNRLLAAGVVEIEGDRWTTLHPRYRLVRKAP
jgi:hypothetical protein